MDKIIISLFVSGVLFGSGPCIASCGPVLIAYAAGTGRNVFKAFKVYILFSLSRISVYLAMGILVFFLGRMLLEGALGGLSKYIFILGGAFIIAVGIIMLLGRRLEFKPFQFLYRNILERDKKSIVIIGLIIGLLPCAPLLAILSYIGLISKSWADSLLYAFVFGLGTFISPLILLLLLSGLISRFVKEKNYCRVISFICGLVIIFLGVQLAMRAFHA